jgi:hypothetical protein
MDASCSKIAVIFILQKLRTCQTFRACETLKVSLNPVQLRNAYIDCFLNN